MATGTLAAAAACVLTDEGYSSKGGGGTAGGGGGTTSWVFDEAVGEPGGGAGAEAFTQVVFDEGKVCLVTFVAAAVDAAAVVALAALLCSVMLWCGLPAAATPVSASD